MKVMPKNILVSNPYLINKPESLVDFVKIVMFIYVILKLLSRETFNKVAMLIIVNSFAYILHTLNLT